MEATRRIGVLTSGGDAPGMNAAVRAVVRKTITAGYEAIGIERGYEGLLDGDLIAMDLGSVGGILDRGGTVLGTSRSERMFTVEGLDLAQRRLREHGVEGLVVVGGDGSFRAALELHNRGVKVMGVPATIDNDVAGTDTSIGFDTTLNTICDATSKVRDTASSHERTFVIEVMGRNSGMLCLYAGLASGADAILVPEVEWRMEDVCEAVAKGMRRGKKHSIIMVAEGAAHAMGLAADLSRLCNHHVRGVVLGYVQRGGAPSAFDRILASRLGASAVDALVRGDSAKMVGLSANQMAFVPFGEATSHSHELRTELYELAMVLAR